MAELRTMKDIHKAMLQWIKDSRWKKKCKRSIKRARHQLLLNMNRMKCIIRQSRSDIAQLISHDHDIHQAFARVEKLHNDEYKLLAYGELEDFLIKIRVHLRHFTRHVDNLDLEIHEAVSNVVLAASCCAELAELRQMRDMFVRWFGNELRKLTGNFVNSSIKDKLIERRVTNEVKLRLITEISEEYSIEIGPFDANYKQNHSHEDSTRTFSDEVNEPRVEPISLMIQDKNDQVVIKRSIFHEVFRMMRSKFFLQSRSSNLITPHHDSCDGVNDLEEEDIKERHEVVNRAFMSKGSSFEEIFVESKDEFNINHVKMVIDGNDVDDVKEDIGEDEKPRLSYVHPKLPDYDELVATFKEYKKECRKNTEDEKMV